MLETQVVDIDLLTPEGTVAVFQSLTAQARLGLFGSDPQKYRNMLQLGVAATW